MVQCGCSACADVARRSVGVVDGLENADTLTKTQRLLVQQPLGLGEVFWWRLCLDDQYQEIISPAHYIKPNVRSVLVVGKHW